MNTQLLEMIQSTDDTRCGNNISYLSYLYSYKGWHYDLKERDTDHMFDSIPLVRNVT